MKNEITLKVTNRGGKKWWLDITMEGRTISLLNGDKDELVALYNRMIDGWKTIGTLEESHRLEIRPFDKNHQLTGYLQTFRIKEEDGTTNSKD